LTKTYHSFAELAAAGKKGRPKCGSPPPARPAPTANEKVLMGPKKGRGRNRRPR
jgi:hypothetical protein